MKINMIEQLENSTHDKPQLPKHIIQNETVDSDGQTNSRNYESDTENEKPILLELGATPASTGATTTTPTTELPTSLASCYATDYPLDIHINSSYGISVAHHPIYNNHHHPHHPHHSDHASLYNNPYIETSSNSTHPANHLSTSSPSPILLSLTSVPYSTHIPQTVYTWSTPTPVTSITTEVGNKLTTEIVPAPIYMSYMDARELKIHKESNPAWKEKVLQSEKDYKKTACDRERTRMRDMNRAFDLLRSKLPISKPNGKKYSKIESLRIAINYINHLQQTLKESIDSTSSNTNFTKSSQNTVEYLAELSLRRRSQSYRYENQKSSSYDESADKLDHIDESRSAWSDGYLQNSQDKWE